MYFPSAGGKCRTASSCFFSPPSHSSVTCHRFVSTSLNIYPQILAFLFSSIAHGHPSPPQEEKVKCQTQENPVRSLLREFSSSAWSHASFEQHGSPSKESTCSSPTGSFLADSCPPFLLASVTQQEWNKLRSGSGGSAPPKTNPWLC